MLALAYHSAAFEPAGYASIVDGHSRAAIPTYAQLRDNVPPGSSWGVWDLTALTADSRRHKRWDALVVVKPLHLVGGVGSPPNATALR